MTQEMPTDPFREQEEAQLQEQIELIDDKKRRTGVSWGQHVATLTRQWRSLFEIEYPELTQRIDVLEAIQPDLARAEHNRKRYPTEFKTLQRLVVSHIMTNVLLTSEIMRTEYITTGGTDE